MLVTDRQTGGLSVNSPFISELLTKVLEKKNLKLHSSFMEAYDKGLTINGYDSPYHFMKDQMKLHPKLLQQIAMIQDITVTYEQMMQTVDKVAAFLHDILKMKKNENISVCALSSIEGIEAFFAMNKLGLVNARIFNGTQEEKMREDLQKFQSKTIFTDAQNLPVVCAAGKGTELCNIIVMTPKCEVPQECMLSVYFWEDIIKMELQSDFEESVSAEDLAAILYTSGSSGDPKPISISNRVYVNMVELTSKTTDTKLNDGERVVGVVSHEYPYAAINSTLMILLMGKTLIMPKNTESGEIDFDEMMTERPHRIQAIPNFYKLMQEYIEKNPRVDLSFLKNVISGGESYTIPEKISLYNALKKAKTKAFIIDGFGFGEMGSATALKFGLSRYFLLMNGVEAMAVNPETNEPLGLDEEGLLCITGPTISNGYYNDEEGTKKSFIKDKDGKIWFKSDTYGLVHGKKRRLISLGGRVREYFITGDGHGNFLKVYAGKVELVIMEIPYIKDCIVVPSDDTALPTPVLYYSLTNSMYDEKMIKNLIEAKSQELEVFCRPTEYYMEQEIQRTRANKKDYLYYKKLQLMRK